MIGKIIPRIRLASAKVLVDVKVEFSNIQHEIFLFISILGGLRKQ